MRLGMYRDLERKPTTVSKNLMIQTKAKFYWRMILLAKKIFMHILLVENYK